MRTGKVKTRSVRHKFGDLTPHNLDIAGLVANLPESREELIKNMMGLTVQLAGEYISMNPERRHDDILGVAMLALCEAVKSLEEKEEDHDFPKAYICKCVRGKIANYLKSDSTVRVPKDVPKEKRPTSTSLDFELKINDPVYCDTKSIITKITENNFEVFVLKLRWDGYNNADIGRISNKSRAYIGQVLKRIGERYNEIYKSNITDSV